MRNHISYTRWNLPVPSIFESAKLSDFPGFVAPEKGNVLVTGPNGVGKSHLAAALGREWGGSVKWVDIAMLMTWIRSTFRDDTGDDSESMILNDVLSAQVLVLDDLLAGKQSEYWISTLLKVTNQRIYTRAPTVVTCDKPLAAIDALDSSLASRLGGFVQIRLDGKDRRLEQNAPGGTSEG